MLLSLQIQNFILIDHLEMDWKSGFTALTGETGAGKSILLGALGLILGQRGESGLIRSQKETATIVATFDISRYQGIKNLLLEQGIPGNDDILLIRRQIHRTQPSRAYVNDVMVSLQILKDITDSLVEVHGQFDHLLSAKSQRQSLDTYGGIDTTNLQLLYDNWQGFVKQSEQTSIQLDFWKNQSETFKYYSKELEDLSPKLGEEEELTKQKHILYSSSQFKEVLGKILTLFQRDHDTSTLFYQAEKSLKKLQDLGDQEVSSLFETMERGRIEIVEFLDRIQEKLHLFQDNPQALEEVEERLSLLRTVARKHNLHVDDLPNFQESIIEKIKDLTQKIELSDSLEKHVETSLSAYVKEAKKLMELRKKSAQHLVKEVMKELPDLKLKATFDVSIEELSQNSWHKQGIDQVAFLWSANIGQELVPLNKSASGGELARLMLALKVILAGSDNTSTLLFDEIDTGVGGAVAAAIGKRLKKLGHHMQVVAITHSPQVSAYAHQHWKVLKEERQGLMCTQIHSLEGEARLDELSRMLSGMDITQEARAAAQALIQQAAE